MPEDAEVFARFTELRRLVIGTIGVGKRAWKNPPDGVLASLVALNRLEVLRLPWQLVVPKQMAALASCRGLRELHLNGELVAFDDALTAALLAIPNLRVLSLSLVPLGRADMDALCRLPLEELELWRCADLDAQAWARLCSLTSLRRLSLHELGRAEPGAQAPGKVTWRPNGDDLRRLCDLPRLTGLAFDRCELRDEDLLALPDRLTELTLAGYELGPEGVRALRRFGALRRLDLIMFVNDFGNLRTPPEAVRAASADALAEALGALRLATLHYAGEMNNTLARSIGLQSELTELRLQCYRVGSLVEVARAPLLRHLAIGEFAAAPSLRVEDLAPLTGCRRLRRVELSVPGIEAVAVRSLLGEGITVEVIR
ncbi:MAG: hypothetical protein ABIP94_04970 [Planctomycetota bacterium]